MDAVDMSGLPTMLSAGVGAFMAVMATVQTWRASQKVDSTQVSVLQSQVLFERTRAEVAEGKAKDEALAARQDREKLNQLIVDQSEMKAQNAVMLEQLNALREENAELKAQIQNFMRLKNVNG